MKKILIALGLIIAVFFSAVKVYAVCPVCTVAVAAGVGLARWLKIDDTITGLWIGGLTVSLIMWTNSYLSKKKINFFGRKIIVFLVYYALIVLPLYFTNIMGHPLNKIWGVDKLALGIIIGSILFYVGASWYHYLKMKNNGHAYFPFQKVVMPIGPLIIMSTIFYFLTKK
ncbi:hypothetical protein KJ713_00940 [Patescibacteria group bacterium]|nr:hypothetical protein [Patescibacteria group bacterium]